MATVVCFDPAYPPNFLEHQPEPKTPETQLKDERQQGQLSKEKPWLFRSVRPLIKPELAHHVHSYAPKSSCFSPYYTYIQSPLCDYIVTFLPTWLAPNLITVSGFMLLVMTHLLMLYLYGTSTDGPFDSWFCVFLGLAYTIYSTLDNIDGK
jgi:hypothetical protein